MDGFEYEMPMYNIMNMHLKVLMKTLGKSIRCVISKIRALKRTRTSSLSTLPMWRPNNTERLHSSMPKSQQARFANLELSPRSLTTTPKVLLVPAAVANFLVLTMGSSVSVASRATATSSVRFLLGSPGPRLQKTQVVVLEHPDFGDPTWSSPDQT